ncbi:MAG TPA: LacI family DNA-binding transcriptional regulator [Gaiellaceae bacterium]|nr:LacI family DNA-binding transcriptional regulator [Gaiellaceae bacterium]
MTIADIAERAGVSKGAVSYALNGQPGVSDATRERILAIADELGWYPNRAARSLSASRAHACGLVIARPSRIIALEPFFMEFISGVEAELSAHGVALTLQLVRDPEEEAEVYRRWWAERRVDGVMLVDLRRDDPRIAEIVRLGLPAVVVGGPVEGDVVPAVWHDEAAATAEVVRYLAALGHERISRVAGVSDFVHNVLRSDAFRETAAELGIAADVVDTDYTPASGARATRTLLSRPQRPTAIVYDSDVLAVTGLGVAHQMGFAVPGDLSIVGWDDSLICRVVHPPLTAMTRDIVAYGSVVAGRLLAEIEGEAEGSLQAPPGELTPRGSTGPPADVRVARALAG